MNVLNKATYNQNLYKLLEDPQRVHVLVCHLNLI